MLINLYYTKKALLLYKTGYVNIVLFFTINEGITNTQTQQKYMHFKPIPLVPKLSIFLILGFGLLYSRELLGENKHAPFVQQKQMDEGKGFIYFQIFSTMNAKTAFY